MHQHERCIKDSDNQRVRRVHRIQDSGSGGKCKFPEIKIRELYLQIRKILYSCSLLRSSSAGCSASAGTDAFHGSVTGMGRLDLPCTDLPGYQLPVCTGHQYSAEFLRRYRWREQSGCPGQRLQLSGNPVPDKICGI